MTSRLLRAVPLLLPAAPAHSLLVRSGPGRHPTVTRFRALSVDGHVFESSFASTVKAASR